MGGAPRSSSPPNFMTRSALTIWTNAKFPDEVRSALAANVAPHQLIYATETNRSNLAAAPVDPQLAAAWKALKQRLATGQFQPTGGTTAQLQAYVQQRELASRRGELLGQLEQVSKQLRELDARIGAEE